MNKSILATMTALALVTGACGKKVPPADTADQFFICHMCNC